MHFQMPHFFCAFLFYFILFSYLIVLPELSKGSLSSAGLFSTFDGEPFISL